MRRYYVAIAVIAVVCAVALGSFLWLKQGFDKDAATVTHLYRLEGAIREYHTTHNTLPDSLEKLPKTSVYTGVENIPLSMFDYTAKETSEASRYTLCAQFETRGRDAVAGSTIVEDTKQFAAHKKGKECFTREITKPEPALPGYQTQ